MSYLKEVKERFPVVFVLLHRARCLWHKHILLPWYRLWVRKDEFHHSLDSDLLAMEAMTRRERERYWEDLGRRRHIACRRGE